MAVAGKNGKVVIGDGAAQKVVGIKSWSLELSLDTLETKIGRASCRERVFGLV